MKKDEIEERFGSMSKECFVFDYRIFANDTLSIPEKHKALDLAVRARGKKYTKRSIENRVSNATSIINAGAAPRALNIVLSSKVGKGVKEQATILLKELDAAK